MAEDRWGQAAVITGAESGIGRAVALALAETHQTLALTWVHSESAIAAVSEEVAQRGCGVYTSRLDFAEPEQIAVVLPDLLVAAGPVSTLVNNAAMPFKAEFLDADLTDVKSVFDVNFFGHYLVTQHVVRDMLVRGMAGVVVNVTSVQHDRVKAGSSAYSCAKAALAQFGRAASVELAARGIRVVSVAPGEIASGMGPPESTLGEPRAGIPMARSGSAAEVASLVRFLASPSATYITGVTVACDGGLSLPLPA